MSKRTCTTCGHGPARFEGCSHTECPNRRRLSAQPIGELYTAAAVGSEKSSNTCDSGWRRTPRIDESE